MSKDLNYIDQHINRALKNYEMPLNPDDWELMNQQLDKSLGKSTAITWSLKCLKFIAAAAVLLSVLYGFKFVHKTDHATITNTTSVITTPNNNPNNTSKNIAEPSIPTASKKDFSEKERTQSAKINLPKTLPLTDTETVKTADLKKQHQASQSLNKNATEVNNFNARIPQNTQHQTITAINRTTVVSSSLKETSTTAIEENYPIDKASYKNNKSLATPITTSAKSKDKKELKLVNSLATISPFVTTSNSLVPVATPTNIPSIVSNNSASKWSVGVRTGAKKAWADINNRTVGINNGVVLTAKVHPLIAVETGAIYFQQKILSANLDNILVSAGNATSAAQQEQQQQGTFFKLVNSKIQTLEVPLLVKLFFRSSPKKLVPYIAAGPSVQVKLKEQYYYEYRDRVGTVLLEEVATADFSKNDKMARQWAMANVHTGLNYHLNKHISLQLEGQAQMSIKKYLIDKTMLNRNLTVNPNQHVYALGVNFGLNYHF